MKRLILIGGSMGVGKTTVCNQLKLQLKKSVFLDGDWCWDMHPFVVNEETKAMVVENICFLLNQFIHCSSIENIIFCWVMHEQGIVDELCSRLDLADVEVIHCSLICDEKSLLEHLNRDIASGVRKADVIERSLERLKAFEKMGGNKINVSNKGIEAVVAEILGLLQ